MVDPRMGHAIGSLVADGFAFVDGNVMSSALDEALTESAWTSFASSWNDLVVDTYLAEHGNYRRRRHAVITLANDGRAVREPHRPHFQSKSYNTLQGGIERWFEPIEPEIADSAIFRRILAFCAETFGKLAPDVMRWSVETHQFRIEAREDEAGQPTPEGVHRDGVDFVLVALIARNNIESGTTTIHSGDGELLGRFTLTRPLDSALVDDARVFHGVTAVRPTNGSRAAYRDVLVVTLRRA